MKFLFVTISFFTLCTAFAEIPPHVSIEKMRIVVFEGNAGGWDPSIIRCRSNLEILAKFASFSNEKGFFSFTGSCTDDPFDKERPEGFYFAAIMKTLARTDLGPGKYSSEVFCLRSLSMANIASLISTEKINFVLNNDNSRSCEDRDFAPVRFDVYIE